MASGRRWKQFSKFFGNIVHYSNKMYKRHTKEGWKEAICSRKPVFSFVFKEMFVSVHKVLPFLTILDLPWPLSWRLIGLHQCAGFPHCSQRLLNSNFGCHKCFVQMCQKCATTDSLTLKNPAQRDRADEERFSRCLKTFTPEVAQEIFSNACLQPGHRNWVKICSQASQPICFQASACCWRWRKEDYKHRK